MKIAHLSDLHISPHPVLGTDPVRHARSALDHLTRHHSDTVKVIITGDLTDRGDEESYHLLRQLFEEKALVDRFAPTLLIGNHDSRANFLSVFPETPCDEHGFVQSVDRTERGWFVYLDTHQPGSDAGHYCTDRFRWLQDVLASAESESQSVWLFMHHNPLPVHVSSSDRIGLKESHQFARLVAQYATTIRHIFFGHCHFTLSGVLHGVHFSAVRSTHESFWPCLDNAETRFATAPLGRHYNLCFIEPGSTVIHTVDFDLHDQVRFL